MSAILLVAAGLLAPAHGTVFPYQGNGAAMAEPESRIATNPALVGSDPRDRTLHARLSLDAGLPWSSWSLLAPHRRMVMRGNTEEILSDQEFLDDLWRLDGRPVSVRSGVGLALWQKDWGASSTLETHPGMRLDHGVLIPSLQIWDSTDAHVRLAVAQPFGAWRVGAGIHVRGQTGNRIERTLRDPALLAREVRALQDSLRDHLVSGWDFAAGLDLGILRHLPGDLQAAARLGDLGLRDRQGDATTPILDVGLAWIPSRFLFGPRWARHLAVGTQWRDALNLEGPTLGHLDVSAQIGQNLAPAGIRIRSSAGLRGGWPCGGLGLSLGPIHLDAASWAEDLDRVLGRTPLRHWDARVQLGW